MTSNTGDADLSGRVNISLDTPNPHGPWFSLSPAGTSPEFVVRAGESKTFEIAATIENNSVGYFTGLVSFGTDCGSLPLTIHLSQSQ